MKHCWITLSSLLLAAWSIVAADTNSTQQHAAALGESVLRLLESRNVESFADALAFTNQFNRRIVSNSARLVLDQATRQGLDPARVHFRVKNLLAKATGTSQNPQNSTKGDVLPTSWGIRITLDGEPVNDDVAGRALRGEYELALGGSSEFPDGWRTYEGIRWSRFPEGLPDERTKREMLLVSNIVARVGEPLHAADDPGLKELGNTLVRFLGQHNEKAFESEALLSFEECWEGLTRKLTDSGAAEQPPRKEIQDLWNIQHGALVESARAVLAQGEILGINFSGAEITLKDVIAVHPYMRGGYGAVDGVDAGPLRFILGVRSDKKSKAGTSHRGRLHAYGNTGAARSGTVDHRRPAPLGEIPRRLARRKGSRRPGF